MANKIPILFKLLTERGISQKKLSDETGISTGNISDWKSGKASPSMEKLSLLSDYLNVSVDYLLGKETSNKKDPASDDQIKFALFGTTEVDDDLYEDIKKIAKIQQQLKAEKAKKG